jgi:hypothetical protein
MTLFCGIDWAETHHDVAIIDNDGQLIAKRRIPDGPSGFVELIEMLTAAGDCADATVPVAIETPRGLLVAPYCGRLVASFMGVCTAPSWKPWLAGEACCRWPALATSWASTTALISFEASATTSCSPKRYRYFAVEVSSCGG